jgi:hypothetical protein
MVSSISSVPNRNHRPADLEKITKISESGVKQMMAAKIFKDKQQLSVEESQLNNFDASFSGSPLEPTCPARPKCSFPLSRYRTIDGTCNHGEGKETWGAAKTPMERLLPPAYEDGIWAARMHGSDGSKLTSARTISNAIFPDIDRPHPLLNLMVMQFGQFLSHDFTQSSSITLRELKKFRFSQSFKRIFNFHSRWWAHQVLQARRIRDSTTRSSLCLHAH